MTSYKQVPGSSQEAGTAAPDVAVRDITPPAMIPSVFDHLSSDQHTSDEVGNITPSRLSPSTSNHSIPAMHGTVSPEDQETTASNHQDPESPSSAAVVDQPIQECGLGTISVLDADLGQALFNDSPTHKDLSTWRRIGITSCLVLAPGSLVISLVLALLGKVWSVAMAAAKGSSTNMPWLYILESSRTTNLVTISTAIIRTIATLQSGLATAMLASLIIERAGAPLWHIPLLSILRATSSNPTSLIPTVARRTRPRDSPLLVIQVVVILELLLVLAIQFFSITLLSDFRNTGIRGPLRQTTVMVDPDGMMLLSKFWSFPASTTYTFAEKSEKFVRGTDFEDTGHTYRAFLPFMEETERLALRWYNGSAMVMDNQVVCLSPSLDSLRWVDGYLEGYMSWDDPPSLLKNGALNRSPFRCQTPTTGDLNHAIICFLDSPSWEGILRDVLVPPLNHAELLEDHALPESDWLKKGSTIILTLLTADVGDVGDFITLKSILVLGSAPVAAVKQDGPWTIVGNPTVEIFKVSACLTGLGTDIYTVTMERNQDASEPKVTVGAGRGNYSTIEFAIQQLGAVQEPRTPEERGLLRLSPRDSWGVGRREIDRENRTDTVLSHWHLSFAESLERTLPRTPLHNRSTGELEFTGLPYLEFHPFAGNRGFNAPDTIASSLYLSTLSATKSPALALQVILTKLSQTWFYTTLPLSYAQEEVEIASSSFTFLPVRARGLLCVVAILSGHLILVLATTVAFAYGTRRSLIGHSWSAISQVRENEVVAGMLEKASDMRDDSVTKWVKKRVAKEDHVIKL